MIDPEDFNEKAPKPYTPFFVLAIAAVLVLIVGFISYRDYVNSRADRKLASSDERIRELEQKITEMSRSRPEENRPPSMGNLAKDEELERIRQEMTELKRQTEENRRKTEEVLNQRQDSILPPIPSEILNPTLPPDIARQIDDSAELPAHLRDALISPPPGGKATSAEVEQNQMAERIRNAAAIGKVVYFNSEHNLVVFDAGRKNNVEEGQRYSIRRGSDILGAVKVLETSESQSNALIVSGNLKKAGESFIPVIGDDVILLDPY